MSRRLCFLVGFGFVLALLVGMWIYFWPGAPPPEPPVLVLDDADPEFRASVEQARSAIHAAPKSASAWAQYGMILRAGVYREQAAECFAEAARLDPHEPRWPYLRGEALMPSDPAAAGESLRQAVLCCQRAHVEELEPRLRWAEALLANGQLDEADDCLQRILETDPEQPLAHLLLGRVAYARNNLPESRDHWTRCLESRFTRRQASIHLAELSRRLGEESTAEKFQKQANWLPADWKMPDPWLEECMRQPIGTAGALRQAAQLVKYGRFAEAVQAYREIVARGPNYQAYVGLGRFLPELGDLAGAEQALREALVLDPKGSQARYYLSRVLLVQAEQKQKAGTAKEAKALLEESVELASLTIQEKPDYGLAHLSMGIALKLLHRNREAIEALRKAMTIMPDLPDPCLHLAELLAAEGKTDEARRLLRQALPLTKPDDTRVQDALAKLDKPR
jgi:tetratricopeptide (TPR) repeat protein